MEDRTLLTAWAALVTAPLPGPVSGRITGIAADPGNANIVYVAAAGGGIWKTTDAQDANPKWTPLTDSIPGTTDSMGAIAIAPSNANVLYAGTGETSTAAFNNYGNGILVSTDGGSSWTLENPDGIFTGLTVSKIVVDPTNADIAYAALSNRAYDKYGIPGTGIYKTNDGGATWTNTTTSITMTEPFSDVALDPKDPSTLYAAISADRNPPSGFDATGIYKSSDGGSSWSLLANFPHGVDYKRITLAISDSNPSVIYAAAQDASTGDLAEMGVSTDGGSTWTNLPNTPNEYIFTIAVDPLNSAIVYAGSDDGPGFPSDLIESTNSGASWTFINSDDTGVRAAVDYRTMTFDANSHLLTGSDIGIHRKDADPNKANGFLWANLNGNLNTLEINTVSLNDSNGNVLANSKDAPVTLYDPVTGKWKGTNGTGDFGMVAFATSTLAYNSPLALYAPTSFFEVSNDGGNTWKPAISGLDPNDTGLAFAIDPSNPDRVVYGAVQLYQTTNAASSWTKLTSTGANGWNLNGNTVSAIGLAASDANTIYAATGYQRIFVSSDGGATWTERDLPRGSGVIAQIVVDPTNAQTAYAVINTFGGGRAFKTTDGGATWTDISGNLPDLPTWSIQFDAAHNVLFVGNDQGVYSSTDGGKTWSRFGTGFPNVRVFSLDYNAARNVLLAGTYGRGAWEISLVSAPAQVTTDPTNQSVTAGQSATFTAEASGYPPPTVQWQVSTDGGNTFTDLSGATSTTLTLNNVNFAMNGNEYRAVFTNSLGSATTSSAALSVLTAPLVTTNPSDQTVAAGQSAMFTATAVGNPSPTVQWQLSTDGGNTFTDLSGATSTTLTLSNVQTAQNDYHYRAVFTNSLGSVSTKAATLSVQTVPLVTSNPADQTVSAGQSVAFTAAASSDLPLTVQWQLSTDGGKSFANISGATDTTLRLINVTFAMNGNEYRAVFTNSIGSATTNTATLSVQTIPLVATNPSNQTVTAGQTATFTATAIGNPSPTVQWQVSTDGGNTFTDISGASDTTLKLNNVTFGMSGNKYRAVFINSLGSATTVAAVLSVQTVPQLTTTPSDQTVTAGQTATFTASAVGNPSPTVQWQVSTDGGNTFTDLSGATSTTLTLSNAQTAQNGYHYRAVFTNGIGSATTSAATLTVQTVPRVTSNPADQTVTAGQSVAFTAAASSDLPLTVQWQLSTDGGNSFANISGATDTTLTLNNIQPSQNGHKYRAVFTNSAGPATTTAATLTVQSAPVIVSGSSAAFTVGQSGSFTVSATGFPPPSLTVSGALPSGVTFTSNGNGTGTLGGTPIAGTTGTYQFTITAHNGVGSDFAQNFMLTVNAAPTPSSPPALNVPPLLALLDSLLHGVEAVNANGTETITDSFFGIPLLVSTYDGSGNLLSVTLFGFNLTFLFV